MTAWCAICTADIVGEPSRESLGRDGGLVNVCPDCSSAHPRSGRYAFDGGGEVRRGVNLPNGTGCKWVGRPGGRKR